MTGVGGNPIPTLVLALVGVGPEFVGFVTVALSESMKVEEVLEGGVTGTGLDDDGPVGNSSFGT